MTVCARSCGRQGWRGSPARKLQAAVWVLMLVSWMCAQGGLCTCLAPVPTHSRVLLHFYTGAPRLKSRPCACVPVTHFRAYTCVLVPVGLLCGCAPARLQTSQETYAPSAHVGLRVRRRAPARVTHLVEMGLLGVSLALVTLAGSQCCRDWRQLSPQLLHRIGRAHCVAGAFWQCQVQSHGQA